jgi:heptosyltransferase-3
MPVVEFGHWLLKKAYTLAVLHRWRERITPIDPRQIKKILIIRNDNIGDVVCTTPLIEWLRRSFPQAYLAVLVCRLTEEVVRGNPYLDRVYVYDKAKHGRHATVWKAWWEQFQVLKEIRKEGFDLVLGVRLVFTVSQAWMAFFSRARWRLGRTPGRRERKFAFFYTHFIPVPDRPKHEIERTLDFLEPLGLPPGEIPKPFFPSVTDEEAEISHLLGRLGVKDHRPLIGVHLTSRPEVGKFWPVEHYVTLLAALKERKGSVVFSYGPDQIETAQVVLRSLPFSQPHFLSSNLRIFAAYARFLDLLVTVDGGPMHIGAAVGVPLVALFGAADPREWAPWTDKAVLLKKGDRLEEITPEEVLKAVEERLRAGGIGKEP